MKTRLTEGEVGVTSEKVCTEEETKKIRGAIGIARKTGDKSKRKSEC